MTARLWKCKDGRVINVAGMSDEHVLNALAMLRRKGFVGIREKLDFPYPCGFNGEMARMAAEHEWFDFMSKPSSPAVDWFDDEVARRGLKEKVTS